MHIRHVNNVLHAKMPTLIKVNGKDKLTLVDVARIYIEIDASLKLNIPVLQISLISLTRWRRAHAVSLFLWMSIRKSDIFHGRCLSLWCGLRHNKTDVTNPSTFQICWTGIVIIIVIYQWWENKHTYHPSSNQKYCTSSCLFPTNYYAYNAVNDSVLLLIVLILN